jgi:hypothetical protein
MAASTAPIPAVQPNLTIAEATQIGGKLIYRSTAWAAVWRADADHHAA